MNRKFTILIILILLLIAGGVFWWWESGEEKEAEKATEESKKETILTPELEKSMDVFVEAIENREIADQKILPDGIQIIKTDDKKIIKNEVDNFQIEIPIDFILKECLDAHRFTIYKAEVYKEDVIEGGIPPTGVENIYIAVEEDIPENAYLKRIITEGEKEEIIISGEKGYKTKNQPPRGLNTFDYILLKNNKIYFISIPFYELESPYYKKYQDIISSFKFLE